MARIAILGATSKLGEHLVGCALEQGYSVTALARDPLRIKRQNEHLTVIKGNAQTGEGLDAVVEQAQYVVSALGSLVPVMESCMQQLVPRLAGLKGLKRFVLISRLGTGQTLQQSSRVSGPIQARLPVLLMPLFRDINLAEKAVRDSALPYTIVRATRLTDDPPTDDVAMVGPHEPPPHRIGRADLARFVMLMLEWTEYQRAEMTVGTK